MGDFEGDSSGQMLVNDLMKKDGTEFVMLTGSFDQAMQQTRVNMTRRKVLASNQLSAPQKESVDLNKLGSGASDHVKNVVLGLSLGDGEYLIAIAWSTAEQVRIMIPHLFFTLRLIKSISASGIASSRSFWAMMRLSVRTKRADLFPVSVACL